MKLETYHKNKIALVRVLYFNSLIFIAVAMFYVSGFTLQAQAAELSLFSDIKEFSIGQQFQVDLILDTENEEVNALEGKIIFPQDVLELKEIRDGNSIVNFWVDPVRNCVSNGVEKPDEICFSGITPGGYMGKEGLIFQAVFYAKKEGRGVIEIREPKILLNDGQGTAADVKISNFQFLISKQIPISQISIPEIKDNDLPEEFTPQIAADPAIFDGKWFLVFATQDKGSGVDHYEVCEGKRECVSAESPYLLQNQDLDEKIVVKAVDKSGNERITTLAAQKPAAWYKNYLILAIIILVIAIVYLLWRAVKSKIKYKKSK